MDRDTIRASVMTTPERGTAPGTTSTPPPPRTHAPTAPPQIGQKFFPAVPFGAIWVVLAVFIALVILALSQPAPLQAPADPLNKSLFVPRPEWYFLFLFQLLKYFPGPTEIIATLGIPLIAGAILVGLPFYDRNPSRDPKRRPIAITSAVITIAGLMYFTWVAQGPTLYSVVGPLPGIPASTSGGATYAAVASIFSANCYACHGPNGSFKSVINLSSYSDLMAGGHMVNGGVVAGSVVAPGNSSASYLYQVVSGKMTVGAQMPLGGIPLTAADQATIKAWIDAGAKGPNGETPPASTSGSAPTAAPTAAPTTAPSGGGSPASGGTVSYDTIQSIFTNHCAACHGSAGSFSSIVNLSSYANLMKGGHAVNGGPIEGPIVKPGDATHSYLYQALDGTMTAGAQMPLGGPYLSQADLANVKNWINQGAKGPGTASAPSSAPTTTAAASTPTTTPASTTAAASGSPVHYSAVQAILANHCAACHGSAGSFSSIVNLSSYDNLMKGGHAVNGGPIAGAIVKPGDAAHSYLYQALDGTMSAGAQMPLGGPYLSQADLATVKNWINQGAKNS